MMTADGTISMLIMTGIICLYLLLAGYTWFTARELYDSHKYISISLHCLAVILLFVLLPLTIYALTSIGWISMPPPSNLTEIRNLTI